MISVKGTIANAIIKTSKLFILSVLLLIIAGCAVNTDFHGKEITPKYSIANRSKLFLFNSYLTIFRNPKFLCAGITGEYQFATTIKFYRSSLKLRN